MSDLIERQTAIDAVEESRRLNHHQDGKEACAHEYEHRHFLKILRDLPSAQPNLQPTCNNLATDCVSRQDAIDSMSDGLKRTFVEHEDIARKMISKLPSALPDNRLSKIANLVEGTIDHFDLDDAMDLLYQIKEVLK